MTKFTKEERKLQKKIAIMIYKEWRKNTLSVHDWSLSNYLIVGALHRLGTLVNITLEEEEVADNLIHWLAIYGERIRSKEVFNNV